jgi:hypothetical protein
LGECSYKCFDGYDDCGNGCFDLKTSTLHCGSCDKSCSLGQLCSSGICGTLSCANSCTSAKPWCCPGDGAKMSSRAFTIPGHCSATKENYRCIEASNIDNCAPFPETPYDCGDGTCCQTAAGCSHSGPTYEFCSVYSP